MFALDIFFLLNSANVTLLLNTISDSNAKMRNQDIAGPGPNIGIRSQWGEISIKVLLRSLVN